MFANSEHLRVTWVFPLWVFQMKEKGLDRFYDIDRVLKNLRMEKILRASKD